MTEVRIRRRYILEELARELYHNPAILDIVENDDLVFDSDKLPELLHDLGMIYARVIQGAARGQE